MPSLTSCEPLCSGCKDEASTRALLSAAVHWSDDKLLDNWVIIENSLAKPLSELEDLSVSTLRDVLEFLNRILQHKFYSLQSSAVRLICTENFIRQVNDLTLKQIDVLAASEKNARVYGDMPYLMHVYDAYFRFAAKACEMNGFFSKESLESVVHIMELIDKSAREYDDEPSLVCPGFRDFKMLYYLVFMEPIYPSHFNFKELINLFACNTEFHSVHHYLSWLYLNLKIDFGLSIRNCRGQESSVTIQAKVVALVLDSRPYVSMGLEFNSRDYFKMIQKVHTGELMVGSLFTITLSEGIRITGVVEKRVVFGEGTVAVLVKFHLEGKHTVQFNCTHNVELAQEYFEPYRKVLSVLKRMAQQDIPLLSSIISPRSFSPQGKNILRQSLQFLLNDKQKEAFSMCLSYLDSPGVHLIQGPPGTGKTYVALEIIGALLDSCDFRNPHDDCQILIISQKNDTVDHILLSLLRQNRPVLRLGGMSNQPCLQKEFNFSAITNFDPFHKKHISSFKIEQKEMTEKMEALMSSLERLGQGILALSDLEPILSSADIAYLESNAIADWLFEFEPPIDASLRVKHVSSIMNSAVRKADKIPGFVSLITLEYGIKRGMNDLKSMAYQRDSFERFQSLSLEISLSYNIRALMEYCKKNPGNANVQSRPRKSRSLASLDRDERWELYRSWLWALEMTYSADMSDLIARNEVVENRINELSQSARANVVRTNGNKVIGATTCAAAAHRLFLEKLKPKIVIVEEAAEVLEAHIVAALTTRTTSLVLIGDHCQKNPQPASALHESVYV